MEMHLPFSKMPRRCRDSAETFILVLMGTDLICSFKIIYGSTYATKLGIEMGREVEVGVEAHLNPLTTITTQPSFPDDPRI
jgi:hypothetical protein